MAEMEPVARQYRWRVVYKDQGPDEDWSGWFDGPVPDNLDGQEFEFQERPVYTAAQLAEARAQAWDEGREVGRGARDPENPARARKNPYRSE